MTVPPRSRSFAVADRHVRIALGIICAAMALAALLFILQVPWALALWPYTGRTQLSNIFIASIFLAAAGSGGWCLLTRSDRGLSGIALDSILIFTPFAIFSVAVAVVDRNVSVGLFAAVSAAGTLLAVWLLRWSLRHPWRDPRPTPRPVRVAFGLFVGALWVASTLLILQVPKVLPWPVTPQLSTLYGLMFLGASGYFLYGIVVPRWENAGGQLTGFLMYDLVLAVPLLRELTAPGKNSLYDPGAGASPSLNLVIYAAVVIGSGLLALWYLVGRREYRPWNRAVVDGDLAAGDAPPA